jgi:hypothetical protein
MVTSVAQLTANQYTYPGEPNLTTDVERLSTYGYPQIVGPVTFTTSNAVVDAYL